MQYKIFGNSPIKIPVLGQGTTGTGPLDKLNIEDDLHRVQLIKEAIDLGMTWIDTAELYGGGHAEMIVGQAIRSQRDKIFLSSKFNSANSSNNGIIQALEASLKRLNTEYIDLYQIHWPSTDVSFEETFGTLEKLVTVGKIKHIGIGNISFQELKEIHQICPSIRSVQMEYNPVERGVEQEILPYCQKNNITLIAYSALSYLNYFANNHLPLFERIESVYQLPKARAILDWLISKPGVVVLVKTTSTKHNQQNAKTINSIGSEDLRKMDSDFNYPVSLIPISEISVTTFQQNFYDNINSAQENALDLIPAPREIATRIKKYNIQKPIWIRKNTSSSPQKYELLRDQLFFWGWIMAYGSDRPIPAYVL